MWEIKGKDNTVKATIEAVEYNGKWMEQTYVTATIESPTPINFEIGDYLIYRDERFEINYDPGKIKSAPRYEKGDAFKYENFKFNSLADELTRCDFLDVVLNDNQLHFTGLPKFSFYGNVQDLANRMQANLDRTYGKGTWRVEVSPEYTDRTEINVSVDNIKVQGALSILVNDYKAYYTIKGRTLTIGAAGVPAGHLFKYGEGNGLYGIEHNAEADQAIVTRVRAYGSTRNLPHRYYNSLTGTDGQKLIPDNMAVQHLMLPSFPYTTQDPYVDSPNIAKLGIREGTIFFDGSMEGLPEIYPSIEGMTAEDLHKAGVVCNATGALDEIVGAEQMIDNGVGEINEGETQTTAKPATFKITLKDLGFDINDHLTTETATVSFKTGMLGGRGFEIAKCKKIESGGKLTGYELELNRVYDDDTKLWFPYSSHNAKAGDKFVILHIEMPEVYIKAASQRLLDATKEWLSKNDYSRSIYAPKIDENFMARQHDEAMASDGKIKSLHDTLKEGMLLLFEDEDLNIGASIFIDSLTIKEGDGPIPTYEVVLKEEKTVGRLDKMQNQIDSLAAGKGQGGYTAAQIRKLIDAYGGSRFLSKLKDDRSAGKIASDLALEVGEFLAGVSGAKIGIDKETGQTFGEMDKLFIRVKAYFDTLTIINAESLAGEQRITPGGGIMCTSVAEKGLVEVKKERPKTDAEGNPLIGEDGKPVMEEYTEMVDNGIPSDVYRCYFLSEQDGEKTETKIVVGDQAISQMFNAKTGTSNKVSNYRYWRLVTGVSNDAYTDNSGNRYGCIDLSKTDCEKGSDAPQDGDTIVQFGNRTDRTRQAAMVFSTVDADAPSIKLLTGIDSYTLDGKDIISYGYDTVKGNAYFNCYGDTYIGDPKGTTFIKYDKDTEQLDIKAKLTILPSSTIDGKSLEDWLVGHGYTDDTLAQAAKDAADAAKTAADNAQSSVNNLNIYVDGAFKDGIITEAEATSIANYINLVNSDKERIDGTYTKLYANSYLTASDKAALKTAYDDVSAKVAALISAINAAIADGNVTAEESAAVDNAFATFNTANGVFGSAVETANKAIQDALKSYSDSAKAAADVAKSAADNAKSLADAAKNRLDEWAADGVISPTEKQAVRDEIARIDADKAHIEAEYARYGLGTPTAYNAAHKAYRDQLAALSATTPENIPIPQDFAAKQIAYYSQRTAALSAIAKAAKDYADSVATAEAAKAVADYEYLKKAMVDGATQAVGGLFLSSYIKLGTWDKSNPDKPVFDTPWSGLNGVYVNGRTPSYFAGGDMVDRFDANDHRLNVAGTRYAKAMVRMDGSAYFADGNIGFRKDGSGWLGNDLTGIKFDSSGAMTFGSGVKFDVANINGLQTTLETLGNFNVGLSSLLVPCDANGKDLQWTEATQSDGAGGIRAKGVKAKVDLFSQGGVTALGQGSGSPQGGGAGGGAAFSLMRTWDAAQDGNGNTQYALGANLGWELKKRVDGIVVPSLDGYATQAWVEAKKYLTSHQTLHTLTVQKNGAAVGTFKPNADKTINITDVASAATLSSHVSNATVHITAAERTKWNKVVTDFAAITGADTSGVIDKWEEVVAFLDTYTEADTLAGLLSNKADKAVKISAGAGLTGGGTLASDTTLALADSGVTAGTWFKTTVDRHGRVTAGANPTSLAGFGITDGVNKVATSGSGNAVASVSVSGHTLTQTKGSFATKDEFDALKAWIESLFEKVQLSGGGHAIRAKLDLYSEGGITALGQGSGGVSGGGGSGGGSLFGLMREWPTADPGKGTTDALGANLGWGLKTDVDALKGAQSSYVKVDGSNGTHSGVSALIRKLGGDVSAALTDSTRIVTSNANGESSSDNLYYRRPASALWSYVKGKADSLYQAKGSYVTLNTSQTVTGAKTFASANPNCITVRRTNSGGGAFIDYYALNSTSEFWRVGMTADKAFGFAWKEALTNAKIDSSGNIYATAFKKSGGTAAQFLKADGSVDSNSYLTTGSASSTYVKKAGDTMAGDLSMGDVGSITHLPVGGGIVWNPYVESSTDPTDAAWIKLIKAGVAGGSELQIQMMNDVNDVVNINTNSLNGLRVKGSIVWNQGNDGAGSGLDADTLDGAQLANLAYRSGTINFLVGSAKANITTAQFITKLTALGAFNHRQWSVKCGWVYASNDIITDTGLGNIQLAGAVIEVQSNSASEYIIRITTSPASTDSGVTNAVFIYRNHGSQYAPGWKRLANTTDNVASATKLQTARTIWGQSFNGTGNVNGLLTINYTGETGLALYRKEAGSGAFMRFYNANQTANYFRVGMYGDSHFGIAYNSTDAITVMTSGNVGIGTVSPAYRLDVNGTARVAKLVIGSAEITWDADHGALRVSKDVYSDGGVTALGASGSTGGGGGTGGSSYSRLDTWGAYASDKAGYVLSAGLGYDLHTRLNGTYTKGTVDSLLGAKADATAVVTALGTNGNYLTWTKNGSTNNLTVPYATNANQLAKNTRMDYGWNGLNYFNATMTAGCAAKVNDSPTTGWWHILRFNHANGNGFYTDLAVPFNNDSLYWKCVRNGALAHTSWVKVLDTLNYAGVLDGRYYTKAQVDAKNFIKDAGDGRTLQFNYSASALGYDAFTWVAVWNGSTLQCVNKSVFLTPSAASSAYLRRVALAENADVAAVKDDGLYKGATDGISQTLKNAPFSNSFAMLNVLCYDGGADLRRARVAVDCYGHIKVFNDRGTGGTGGTWREIAGTDSNVASATKLQTARSINGTAFNGTADITTARWGTARTLTVGATGKSVNGSGAVSWSLDEIGVYSKTASDGKYVGLAGTQTVTGAKTFTAISTFKNTARFHSDTRGIILYPDIRGKAAAIEILGANGGWAANCLEFENSGSVLFHKDAVFKGRILPNADNTSEIGSALKYFKRVYTNRIEGYGDLTLGHSDHTKALYIDCDGWVGIGTDAPDYELDVVGTIRGENILSMGGVTALSSSDFRLKENFRTADYCERLLSLGSVTDFNYNALAVSRKIRKDEAETTHTSVIYQQALAAGIPGFCHTDEDGYGAVNFLSADYQGTLLGAVQALVAEVARLKKELSRPGQPGAANHTIH